MEEITCVLGRKITLTDERYLHITLTHPEMDGKKEEIIKTLKGADFIQKSVHDENIQLYYKSAGKGEYFVVVVKVLNNHGFIITSYKAGVIKKGDIVWKK